MADEKLLREMGMRINARRKELCMTQERLAEKLDVSVQMISNLELGKKAIRPENLVKLCTILNTGADYILCGTRSERELMAITEKYSRLSVENQRLVEALVDALSDAEGC